MKLKKLVFRMSKNKKPYHYWVFTKTLKSGDFVMADLSSPKEERGPISLGVVNDDGVLVETNYTELMDFIYDVYIKMKRDKKIKEILDVTKTKRYKTQTKKDPNESGVLKK